MKRIVLSGIVVLASLGALAEVFTVKSGDVAALTNYLQRAVDYGRDSCWNRIELEPGDYGLTGIQMEADSSNGGSHLLQAYISIRGKGDSPGIRGSSATAPTASSARSTTASTRTSPTAPRSRT